MSTATPDLRGRMYRERRLIQPAETTESLRRQKVANVGSGALVPGTVYPTFRMFSPGSLIWTVSVLNARKPNANGQLNRGKT
jgi:hypothetical protein